MEGEELADPSPRTIRTYLAGLISCEKIFRLTYRASMVILCCITCQRASDAF